MVALPAITIHSGASAMEVGAPQLPVGTMAGVITDSAGGLAVRVGAIRIPLPEGAPFSTGQSVEVTRTTPGGSIEIRANTQNAASPSREAALAEVLGRVLAGIPRGADATPQLLAPLLPRFAPLSESQIRQVAMLFTARGSLGPQLAALGQHVQAAIGLGWIAPEWVHAFLGLTMPASGADADAIAVWIRRSIRAATQSPENALAGDTPADALEGLLTQIRLLRRDPSLQEILRGANRDAAFAQQADNAIDRLESRQIHQLHGLESAYVFAELPSPVGDDGSSIQLHWFREGRGRAGEPSAETVVLDLSLSQLGDVWVGLQIGRNGCQCTLKATDQAALEALEADATDLSAALKRAGYESAAVRVERWNGDRLSEVARLMRKPSGLDVQA